MTDRCDIVMRGAGESADVLAAWEAVAQYRSDAIGVIRLGGDYAWPETWQWPVQEYRIYGRKLAVWRVHPWKTLPTTQTVSVPLFGRFRLAVVPRV